MIEFTLPSIGEGVVEGEIVQWLKKPGDPVAKNEPLVEVMTDKATVEVPAPQDAVVAELRAAEGDICRIGQVIALLAPGEAAAAAGSDTGAKAAPAPQPTQPAPSPSPPAAAPAGSASVAVLATPAARALARSAGVDLARVPGDERGRVSRKHVEAAIAAGKAAAPSSPSASASAPATPTSREAAAPRPIQAQEASPAASAGTPPAPALDDREADVIPFRGLRRKIAEGMTRAYTEAVHYTYVEQIDVSRLVALRQQAKAAAAEEGVKLTYLPFITKAVIHALRKYPIVNSYLDTEHQRIVLHKRYHIGIATATSNGLVVPVVHDADRLSLLDLARAIARVSEAARNGTASREILTGSTFTITSLGQIGGVLATPILNYPEVGILGVHAIRKVPVVDDQDRIAVGHVMNLSVTLDHRIVDGYEGASFLQEVRRYLEDPNLLLLSSI